MCLPGMPVTLIAAFLPSFRCDSTSTIRLSKKSRADISVKDSVGPLDVRLFWACGVVMMGSERRKDASTSWSKWSLHRAL